MPSIHTSPIIGFARAAVFTVLATQAPTGVRPGADLR